jgi:hypothetical protein
LLHLSYNMWQDKPIELKEPLTVQQAVHYQPYLRCDDKLWEELTERMAKAKMNMVVIDLGDGIQYASHPDIGLKDAWPLDKLRKELARLRKMGLEPIPKLNFSTAHDAWLGKYRDQVSTPPYYKVCGDLLDEVIGLFDKPRLFHLGFDEDPERKETWWNDLGFFSKQVKAHGVRPWIWSDYAWHHGEIFLKQMPKDVMQSNWRYETDLTDKNPIAQWFVKLDRNGFDQIPTGSNWISPKNFGMLVEYCRKKIDPSRLKGFLQTPWVPTLPAFRQRHIEAIDQVAAAIAAYK